MTFTTKKTAKQRALDVLNGKKPSKNINDAADKEWAEQQISPVERLKRILDKNKEL